MILSPVLVGLLVLAGAQTALPPEDAVWRNPQNSVHVRVHSCGDGLCGTVIWASDKAKADSARGGTANLIGTQLFRDFHATAPNVWRGKVFVPDLGRVFTGTGTLIDSDTIMARGCIGKDFGCKSQKWTRIGGAR